MTLLLNGKGLTPPKFLKKCIPYLIHWPVFEHFCPNSVYVQGMFNGKPEFFVHREFIANTEIIILLLFNIVPF